MEKAPGRTTKAHRRPMGRTALIAIVSLLLVSSATASPLQRAIRTARSYWPSRCQGQTYVYVSPRDQPRPALPGTEVMAWVEFDTPEGPLHWSSNTYSDCSIHLMPSVISEHYQWLCQILIHEYSHFAGWPDSTIAYTPNDIRYPLLSEANIPSACH